VIRHLGRLTVVLLAATALVVGATPASAATSIGYDGESGTLAGISASTNATVSAEAARHGSQGLAIASTAAPSFARWNPDVVTQNLTHASVRVWVRVLSRKAGESVDLFTVQNARRLENFDVFVNGINGQLQWDLFRDDTDFLPGPMELGRWYLIEAQVEFADGQYTADVRIDGVDQGTIVSTQASTTVRALIVGSESAKTHSQHYDDIAMQVGNAPMGWLTTTSPSATLTRPAEGATFTRGASVSTSFACSGPDFAIVSCDAPPTVDTSTLGSHQTTVTATDTAGQVVTTTHTYTVVDGTAPTVEITTPPDGASYAVGDPVTAAYSCADEDGGSGLPPDGCVGTVADGAAVDTSTVGPHQFSVTATDTAGNTTTVTHDYEVTALPDQADPVIELRRPVDGATYGRGEVVEADFACEDEPGGSGLASCTGTRPSGAAIDTSTLGDHTFTVTAADAAGNTDSVTHTYTVADRTSPTVTLTTPGDGASYARGAVVAADFTCADEIGGTGLRNFGSCQGPVAIGAPIDTWTLGDHSFTATAVDAAGNVGATTHVYTVLENQPDALIALGERSRFVGDDLRNGAGRGQTRSARVGRGGSVRYVVRVQNDTGAEDRFTVQGGRGDRRWRVTYRAGGRDVTRAVTSGRYQVGPLAPGGAKVLRVVVRPTRWAQRGDQKLVRVTTSAPRPGVGRDTVVAVTRRG
jgi:hypothetical protein